MRVEALGATCAVRAGAGAGHGLPFLLTGIHTCANSRPKAALRPRELGGDGAAVDQHHDRLALRGDDGREELLLPRQWTDGQIADLVAFLESLQGQLFLNLLSWQNKQIFQLF